MMSPWEIDALITLRRFTEHNVNCKLNSHLIQTHYSIQKKIDAAMTMHKKET